MSDGRSRNSPLSAHGHTPYQVAHRAAIQAGGILKSHFGKRHDVRKKGKRDLVTEADIASEKLVIAMLSEEFPDYGVMSEESRTADPGTEYTWILDPLDGTNNYYFGIPFFSVNIALECRGEIIMGVTYDPMRNEEFHAVKGKGAFLNRKRIAVSPATVLSDGAVGVDLGYKAERSAELLAIVSRLWPGIHCLRLMGSSSLGIAYVASGRLGMYLHRFLYPWDVASGILLTREAGGDVVNFEGLRATSSDAQIIASNGVLGQEFLRWLKRS